MHTSPPTLPALVAGLRDALEADARGVPNLLLILFAQLEALLRHWLANPHAAARHTQASWPAGDDDQDRLPFHLRLRDARRALVFVRRSKGRRHFPTWWDRNRGARAIPVRALIPTRPLAAGPPPRAEPA